MITLVPGGAVADWLPDDVAAAYPVDRHPANVYAWELTATDAFFNAGGAGGCENGVTGGFAMIWTFQVLDGPWVGLCSRWSAFDFGFIRESSSINTEKRVVNYRDEFVSRLDCEGGRIENQGYGSGTVYWNFGLATPITGCGWGWDGRNPDVTVSRQCQVFAGFDTDLISSLGLIHVEGRAIQWWDASCASVRYY